MGKVVGIISIKGGVGKTTLTASLGAELAQNYGKKVLLVDANYSAPNLGIHLDLLTPEKGIYDLLSGKEHARNTIQTKYGVDIITGSQKFSSSEANVLKLKDKIASLKEDYDFIIIDSSPSLNEEVLSTMLASDNLFVVTTPDYPTLSCSIRAAKVAQNRGKPISGIIVNKIRNPAYELSLEHIEEAIGIPVVARIPDDPVNVKALFARIPTSVYHPSSNFAKEVRKLGAALALRPEPSSFLRRMFSKNIRKEEVNRQLLKDSFYSSIFTNQSKKMVEADNPIDRMQRAAGIAKK